MDWLARRTRRLAAAVVAVCCAVPLTGCGLFGSNISIIAPSVMTINRGAVERDVMPQRYTCADPQAANPPLTWAGAPRGTKSIALVFDDADAPNIVTVGSLSKLYWGGLRVGWARAPAGIADRLAAAKAAADLGGTAYQQGLVAALVTGRHDEIVKWRAGWLRPRYDAAAAALRATLPGWTWTPPSGGLTIWARLPSGLDSDAFAQAALRRGVALVPGRLLSAGGGGRAHLRLAFTRPPEHLTVAIATLGEIRP